MEYDISIVVPENMAVMINGSTIDTNKTFKIEEANATNVQIIVKSSLVKFRWFEWLLYVAFLPIVGLFHIVILNMDQWYMLANPFVLKHKILFDKESRISLTYKVPSYHIHSHVFSPPEIICDGAKVEGLEYVLDINNIKIAFLAFFRKVVSVLSFLNLLLVFLVVFAAKESAQIIILVSIIMAFTLICVSVILIAYFNCKKAVDILQKSN